MAKKKTTSTDKTETFSKKDLEAVANELSTVMKFTEPIPTGKKATVAGLTADIKEAVLELEEGDVISDETMAILAKLEGGEPKAEVKAPEKKVKIDKPVEKEKVKYNRAQAFCDSLAGKGKTMTEIAQKAMDLHAAAHPEKKQPQLSSIEWAVKDYLQPLIILGFVTVKNAKYSLAK